MIKLSIIIPVYEQEQLIVRALDSIPARDDTEIIVIDDASADNTFTVVREYIEQHEEKNIVLLYNTDNLGVGLTVNRGYDVAMGEYVVLLGSDDYFYSNIFNDVVDNYLNGTDLIYFDLQSNNGDIWNVTSENKHELCGSVKFMKRSFIGETRNPDKRCAEDKDFYEELLKKNPTELFTGRIVKHYNFPRVNSLCWLKERGETDGNQTKWTC